jgi:hypothetical protein
MVGYVDIPEKLVVTQLLKKCPGFYETRRFIPVSATDFCPEPGQSISHPQSAFLPETVICN